MSTTTRRPWGAAKILAALLAVLVLVVGVRAVTDKPYRLTLVMPTANQSFVGGSVLLKGERVGQVSAVDVLDGKAAVEVEIDDDHAPLPGGTTARIAWESALGARVVELEPGAERGAPLRSGQLVTGNAEAVDIDDLLATLDAPTRASLQRLVGRLDDTLANATTRGDLNQLVKEAGPTVQALGYLLQSVGEDGPALRKLVTQLHRVTQNVATHDDRLAATVDQLNTLASAVAARKSALSQTIARLPGAVDGATAALRAVPEPVDATRGLLRDIRPATRQLPEVSRLARQVLQAARPALELLPPTLQDADRLLGATPGLLSEANATLPQVGTALQTANPMVDFLRPYTPELIGWLSNWNGVFGSRDATGHYARALITTSATAFDNLPSLPAGMQQESRPQPGSLVGQPWSDAHGDGLN